MRCLRRLSRLYHLRWHAPLVELHLIHHLLHLIHVHGVHLHLRLVWHLARMVVWARRSRHLLHVEWVNSLGRPELRRNRATRKRILDTVHLARRLLGGLSLSGSQKGGIHWIPSVVVGRRYDRRDLLLALELASSLGHARARLATAAALLVLTLLLLLWITWRLLCRRLLRRSFSSHGTWRCRGLLATRHGQEVGSDGTKL